AEPVIGERAVRAQADLSIVVRDMRLEDARWAAPRHLAELTGVDEPHRHGASRRIERADHTISVFDVRSQDAEGIAIDAGCERSKSRVERSHGADGRHYADLIGICV